jgi:aryl-alcohol dehydrogenase-like predicted oxidoreductase
MKRIKLKQTGVEISALCFGTDSIGSKIDEETSFLLLDKYVELGGNWIDTANMYATWLEGCSGGESETTIGKWMRSRRNRDQLFIATKAGFDYGRTEAGLSAEQIRAECDKSLKRLGVDYIDLFYAHRDNRATPLQESLEAFDGLVRAGKVRQLGASNYETWRLAEALTLSSQNGWSPFSVVEQRHTYLRPRHGASFSPQVVVNSEMIDCCQSRHLTLVAYSVLLQGAYSREDRPIPAQYAGPDAEQRMEALESVARQVGASTNQVVIAWLLATDAVPIIAGSKVEQIEENVGALDLALSPEQIQRLSSAGDPSIASEWLR